MKYLLVVYIVALSVVLTLKPAPAPKGPECGPGVLCIRTQKQVQAALEQTTNVMPQTEVTYQAAR